MELRYCYNLIVLTLLTLNTDTDTDTDAARSPGIPKYLLHASSIRNLFHCSHPLTCLHSNKDMSILGKSNIYNRAKLGLLGLGVVKGILYYFFLLFIVKGLKSIVKTK